MVKLRKILFAVFVILYLIICPSLILYSLGIVIKPGSKKAVKTGVIYIASIPSGASITLNGKLLKEETPTLIDNLLPGTYKLELNAAGYQPWETNVSVSAKKATPLDNALLLPDPIATTELSDQAIDQLIPIDDNPFVAVAAGPNTKDIFVHIWDENFTQNILPERPDKTPQLKALFPEGTDQGKGKITKIYSVAASPYLIFKIINEGKTKFLWTDPLLGTSKTEDITNLFPVPPESIEWSQSDPRHLLSFQNNAINRIDIATRAVYPKIIDQVISFTNYGQTIFFLSQDKTLLKTTFNTSEANTRLVSTNPIFNDLVSRHFPFQKMTAVSENIVLLLGKNGELISNLKPYLLADSGIQGFKWNKKPQKIALWSKDKLGIMDFLKSTKDNPAQIAWLQDKAKDITNAFWANAGTHIIFADNDQIFIVDTDCCEAAAMRKIVDIKKQTNIYYSEHTGKIFYINAGTGRLSSADIIAQYTFLPPSSKDKAIKEAEE